MGLTEEDITRF